MKILFINYLLHTKNLYALNNYNYHIDNINYIDLDNINLSEYDIVYSPTIPINVKKYPNTKFIFGPHFSVFPNKKQIDEISNNNSVYIQPSNWCVDIWKNNSICKNIRIKSLPFGVNTKKFINIKHINERDNVFIYFKRRNPNELQKIKEFLDSKQISYKIFDYVKKYNEDEYLTYLQNSKYGIWLGAHESQGFALEEALSCNVPLLVWNVTLMSQEFGSNYNDYTATTIPYWDTRCGEFFTDYEKLEKTYNKFISKLHRYKPREFILENLSIEVCNKLFDKIIKEI
jgi:glycosyltransferase involved in cell wall biosynthesis